ncbi:MAG: class I SAM-dependent methyltransferase [Terriglobia bacterium]
MMTSALQIPPGEAPFDALAFAYDDHFTATRIGRAQREAVTRELDKLFVPGQRILEINCGDGFDAVRLATRGVEVMACDAAPRMIEVARHRKDEARRQGALHAGLSFRVLRIEEITALQEEGFAGHFDGVLSNFSGLNCVKDLTGVACGLAPLLKPRAAIAICVFGKFCAWETLWYLLHANPGKAFRRVRHQGGIARLAGNATIQVYYPSVRQIARAFALEFRLTGRMGIGVTVPPSYLEPLAQRSPGALGVAVKVDRLLGRLPVFRAIADHTLLTFERRERRA